MLGFPSVCGNIARMSRRWLILALIFAGIVINYIDRGSLSIAAPFIMGDFRIAPATMGILLSAFFWTYAVCQIPAGVLVDRVGIRRAYAGGFLIWSLAAAGMALSRGTTDAVGLRLLLGLAESVAPLASVAFIRANFAGEEQGLPTSIYIAGQNLGPAIGALVGAALVSHMGWRLMFAVTGLGGLVWLPCWLGAVPSDAAPKVRATAASQVASGDGFWRSWAGNRAAWALSLAIALASYFWYFVLTWIPTYLVAARGFSTLGMGQVLSLALFTMAAANVAGGAAADRLARRLGVFRARLAFAAAGWAGTGVILLLLVTTRAWALPILIVAMCATGIGNSSFWAIAQHLPPRHLVGRTVGYLNTISVTAGGAAPIVTGYLLGPQKHFLTAILVAGICPVLAASCLLLAGAEGLTRMKAELNAAS